MSSSRERGFTLIELMIVTAIIGVLLSIALPEFAMLHRKSREAATKGNLAALRSAIAIYYGDTEGAVLTDLQALVPKYIPAIPYADFPTHHSRVNTTCSGDHAAWIASFTETCGWFLDYDLPLSRMDNVIANCIHNDASNRKWSDQ